jgi:predicted Zn-dependent protease
MHEGEEIGTCPRLNRSALALSALLASCVTSRPEPEPPKDAPPVAVRVRQRNASGSGDTARFEVSALEGARIEWDRGAVETNAEGRAELPGAAAGKRVRVSAEGRRASDAMLSPAGLDLFLDTPAAITALGRAAELLGMDREAENSYEDALLLDPAQAEAAAGRARLQAYRALQDGQAEALSLLKQAAEMGADGRLYWTLVLAGFEQGRPDLALTYAGRCAGNAACAGDHAWWTGVATLYAARGPGIAGAYDAAAAMATGRPELDGGAAEQLANALEDACKRRRDLCDRSRRDAAAVRARALMRPSTAAAAEQLVRGALAVAPKDGELHYLLGQALALRGLRNEADRAFQEAVERGGAAVWLAHALLALGENTLALTGKGDAAHPFFENAVRASGRHPAVLLRAGTAFERAGRMPAAESLYRWLTEGPPGPEHAAARALLAGMGDGPLPTGDAAPETSWCDAAVEGLALPPSADAKAKARVEDLGKRLADQIDAPGVRWVLLESEEASAFAVPGGCVVVTGGLVRQIDRLSGSPDDALAWVLAHELSHLVRGHRVARMRAAWLGGARGGPLGEEVPSPEAAAAALHEARAEEEDADPAAVYALMRAGRDPGAALATLAPLLRLGRGVFAAGFDHPTGAARLQRLRDGLWRIAASNAAYEQALRDLGKLPQESEDALARIEPAIAAITEMAFLLPRAPEVHRNLGAAYLMLSRSKESADRFRWLVEPDPRAFGERAASLDAGQALLRAEMALKRSLYLRPEYRLAHATYAAVLAAGWKVDGALAEVRASLSGGGGPAWAWNVGGIVAAMRNEADVAEAAFERAVETDPRMAAAAYNLALFYTRAGNAPAARAAWSRYLTLGEKGSWAEFAAAQLEKLGPAPVPASP